MILESPIADRLVSDEALADVQSVAEAIEAGRLVEPTVARRVRERSAEARRKLLASKGVQNIGVGLIRDLRGELPTP